MMMMMTMLAVSSENYLTRNNHKVQHDVLCLYTRSSLIMQGFDNIL